MQRLLASAVLIVFAVLATASAVSSDDQSVRLRIDDMTCATCPITVRKAIQRVDGVRDVEVDFAAKSARVTFDDGKTSVAAIIGASTDAGYPATVTDGPGK